MDPVDPVVFQKLFRIVCVICADDGLAIPEVVAAFAATTEDNDIFGRFIDEWGGIVAVYLDGCLFSEPGAFTAYDHDTMKRSEEIDALWQELRDALKQPEWYAPRDRNRV